MMGLLVPQHTCTDHRLIGMECFQPPQVNPNILSTANKKLAYWEAPNQTRPFVPSHPKPSLNSKWV